MQVWTRIPTGTDSLTGEVYSSIGYCAARNLGPTLVPIVVLLFLMLSLGVYLTYLNRNAPTEFSEGRAIAANIIM